MLPNCGRGRYTARHEDDRFRAATRRHRDRSGPARAALPIRQRVGAAAQSRAQRGTRARKLVRASTPCRQADRCRSLVLPHPGVGLGERRGGFAGPGYQPDGRHAVGLSNEVTRMARHVGTEGGLGDYAAAMGVSGLTRRDLTGNVVAMVNSLSSQVRNIAQVTIAVARGDTSKRPNRTPSARSSSPRTQSTPRSTSCRSRPTWPRRRPRSAARDGSARWPRRRAYPAPEGRATR